MIARWCLVFTYWHDIYRPSPQFSINCQVLCHLVTLKIVSSFHYELSLLYCIVRHSTINLQVMAVPPPDVINVTIYMVNE